MTAAEQRRVRATVVRVLKEDIHRDLMSLYAIAVALNEQHPEQVNNEIRNAVSHLCRALQADSYADAEKQIKRAQESHIERAKRDCLKLSIAELTDRIRVALDHVKVTKGNISPALLETRRELLEKRELALTRDIEGIDGVLESLADAFNGMKTFYDDITASLNLPRSKVGRWRIKFRLAWRWISGTIAALTLSIVAFFITSVWIPDTNTFGHKARAIIAAALSSPAASSPSTAATPALPAPPKQ